MNSGLSDSTFNHLGVLNAELDGGGEGTIDRSGLCPRNGVVLGRGGGGAPTLGLSPHPGPGPEPPGSSSLPFPFPVACPWGLSCLAELEEEDEWGGLFAEVSRDLQSHRPWLLPAPSVCMNSQLGNQEILSIRAGEEPTEISWSNPLVLQIVIIMIMPNGSNSHLGCLRCVPSPWGWRNSRRGCYSLLPFAAEETKVQRGEEMGLRAHSWPWYWAPNPDLSSP